MVPSSHELLDDSIPPLPPPMPPFEELSPAMKEPPTNAKQVVPSSHELLDDSIPPLPPPMPPFEELSPAMEEPSTNAKQDVVNIHAKKLMLKRRQRKLTKDVNKNDPICVEDYQSRQEDTGMWIAELQLPTSDRDILLSQTAWLTDSIIDAAQNLLKKMVPVPGLESVSCGLTMTYSVQPGDFIQILNTGNGHWVTTSTIGTTHPTVQVYDSLYSSAGTRLKAQIAALLATEQPELVLNFMDVPVQSGSNDCGLFAIAFATALALGVKPELFLFDQSKMRRHLQQCLERGKMQMFPVIKKRRTKTSSVKKTQAVPVYCKCRMPELPNENMIECTNCKEWYHLDTCISVPLLIQTNKKQPWFCCKC